MGTISAMLATLAYGNSQFLARKLVAEQAPPLVVTTYALFVGMLVLSILSYRSLARDKRASKKGLLLMALAGATASSGVALTFTALSLAPLVVVSPVVSINPLISLGLAHYFLQRLERITLRIWIGAGLVVAGVTLVTIGSV